MSNEISKPAEMPYMNPKPKAPLRITNGIVQIETLEGLYRLCDGLARSGVAPPEVSRPETIMAIYLLCAESHAPFITALQHAYAIKGRISFWGKFVLGQVQRHPEFDQKSFQEGVEGDGENRIAFCQMGRKGCAPVRKEFSWLDAKRARLHEKSTYLDYTDDMLLWKARHRVMTALFSDAMAGFPIKEEVETYTIDVKPVEPNPETSKITLRATLDDLIGCVDEQDRNLVVQWASIQKITGMPKYHTLAEAEREEPQICQSLLAVLQYESKRTAWSEMLAHARSKLMPEADTDSAQAKSGAEFREDPDKAMASGACEEPTVTPWALS